MQNFWHGRRFVPLLITQFFGAFNDNLFKNTLMTFVAYKMVIDSQTVSIYSNIIAGIFILPYFLFSALAGSIADKYDRSKIARILKITELLLMISAGVVFVIKSPILLIVILFLMGMQSTFFGPVKYALLPQHLRTDELIAGNAYIEASTYISIILGSILGTMLPVNISIGLLLLCALIGIVASFKIPSMSGAQPRLKISFNIGRQIKENICIIKQHTIVFRAIIGATWFWILGTFFLTQLFPLCSKVFNTDKSVVTLFLILFSVGVGAGSIFCNRLLKGAVSVIYVPLSAIGLSVCAIMIYFLSAGFVTPQTVLSLAKFIMLPRGFCISVCLFLFAFMGGMYVVPLNALMQKKAPKGYVATVIAGNNIINSLGMVGISIFAAIIMAFGFKITDLFLFIAILSAGVAFYICKLLPDALVRSIFCSILNLFFRVRVDGIDNLRKAGSKALIIANHVSLLDGVLIAAYLPRKITFAIDQDWANKWYVKIFNGLVDFYPLNPSSPMAIRSLIDEVNKGKTIMIFPEGRISVTGSLMKVYEGAGVIAEKSGAKIIPLRIDGAQYSKFSYIGDLIKTQIFPKIQLFILPPCEISIANNLSSREKRRQTSLKLHDIMADMIYATTNKDKPLFNLLLEAERTYGKKHKVVMDIQKKSFSYKDIILKSYVLGAAYKEKFRGENRIGVMLPNSAAGVVNFFALHYAAKTPVMLNFSLGDMQFASCINTVGLKKIITSRTFVERGKLEHFIQLMHEADAEVVYLEDFATQISLLTKLKGVKKYLLREKVKTTGNKTAAILFTSGSEGLPKAVLLSHRNLQANVLQVHLAVPFNSRDVLINALPMFHSFGLTIGTVLPLLNGVKTFFYPSPLHYRIIPEISYGIQATAILGTDTFLYGYGRMANPYDFFPIRFAVVGGEKLKQRTADLWMKKFGVRIFEGYGTTEMSPVIAVNTPMFYRENTVGRILSGINYRLQLIDGISNGGELLLQSDSMMQGYIKADKPNVFVPVDTWYNTGDIVQIDEDKFVSIEGRAKRFAKIGGEMISLVAVEDILNELYSNVLQCVIAIEDEIKGEKIVFLTSDDSANMQEIKNYFKHKGVSELWLPKEIFYMPKIPLLGSGKIDYQMAVKLYQEQKLS